MQYYSDSELQRILETDPDRLIGIIKQYQKEDAAKNGKDLYFNDEEIVQNEEEIVQDDEYV